MATITDFQSNKSIFISSIPLKTQENDLYKFITEQLKNASEDSEKYTNVIESLNINKKDLYDYAIGFVNMRTHEDAKNAIKVLNGQKMSEQSSPLSVMWNISKRTERFTEEGTVFVRGIKKDVKANDIKELFEKKGETLLVKLSTSENNESNGYAYVRFVEANNVEKVLNPETIEEIKNKIGEENFKIEKCNKPQKQEKRNIYIENIDSGCSDEQIIDYFKTFGEIDVLFSAGSLCVKIVLDEVHGKKKGYVMYKNHEDALKAIQNTHEKKIEKLGGSVLRAYFFKSKLELKMERKRKTAEIKENIKTKYKDSNLYLTSENTELTVRDIIDKLGDGKEDIFYSIRLKVVPEQPVKTAFVCFYKVEDAQSAIKKCEELNNGWKAVIFRPRTQQPQQSQFYPNFMTYYNMMMMSGMPMQQFPVFQQMPYAGHQPQQPFNFPPSNKPKRGDQKKPVEKRNQQKPQQSQPPKQEQKQQEPESVNEEELINVIGDQIYDFVEKLGKYDEDLIARITGVFLESFDIKELEGKLKNPEKELSPIIDEIADTLKNMAQDE